MTKASVSQPARQIQVTLLDVRPFDTDQAERDSERALERKLAFKLGLDLSPHHAEKVTGGRMGIQSSSEPSLGERHQVPDGVAVLRRCGTAVQGTV